jgi:hypothetical protein
MGKSSLVEKLQIKPEYRVVVIAPPPGYMEKLKPLPKGVVLTDQAKGTFDCVQLFVKNIEEMNRLAPRAIRAVKPDGLLWISYPKRSSKIKTDLSRDHGWEVIENAGLEGVTLIAIDEVWSAMRFRPAERVGKPRKQ